MKKLLLAIVVVAFAVNAYQRVQEPEPVDRDQARSQARDLRVERDDSNDTAGDSSRFSCDGRTRCSEMKSCEEARFFVEHCPGTKMDGDSDGIPCEGQHCGH